jgi:hypothetical protein
MRGLADPPFGRFQAHGGLHRARQERILLACLRPDAFVERTQKHGVDMLQPGFERAPDEGTRMPPGARLDHPARDQRIECADPFMSGNSERRAAVACFQQDVGQILAGLVTPNSVSSAAGFIGADPLKRFGSQRGQPANIDSVGESLCPGALDQDRGKRRQRLRHARREIARRFRLLV